MKPNELFNYLKSIKHEEYITAGDDVQYLVKTFHDEKRIRLMINCLASCGLTASKVNNDDLRVILDNFLNSGMTTNFGTVIS